VSTIFFPRFDAVDHPLSDIRLRCSTLRELLLVMFWRTSYTLQRFVPKMRRLRERSVLNVYLGTLLAHSDLRMQIARLRNQAQYGTAGAGIDVGYSPDHPIETWAVLSEWFKNLKTRLHMQMYLKVVSVTPLAEKHVLEVGCGQGDGAAFLSQLLKPAKYIGVDLHPTQVGLCRQRHASRGAPLDFQRANAQQLPFLDKSFDVVVNVESAHSYPSFDAFISEVFRVLKPGGSFCFADLRQSTSEVSCVETYRRDFERAGFTVLQHEDITHNAWKSIDELRNASGGRLWDEWESLRDLFGSRKMEYHWFVLTKPAVTSFSA
jgi:ubiquinone/menaquinone biosynthesis C-methylase UbiE